MGKSWKEKPGKYRYNKDFQKKQQKKHGKPVPSHPYDNMDVDPIRIQEWNYGCPPCPPDEA